MQQKNKLPLLLELVCMLYVTGELANSIRAKTDLKFGLYHSLFEWFNPFYLQDMENNFTIQTYVKQKTIPELYELVCLT